MPLPCPYFGQQMRILSCDVISSATFFASPPSTLGLLLVNPKGLSPCARLRFVFTQIKDGFIGVPHQMQSQTSAVSRPRCPPRVSELLTTACPEG